MKLRSGGAGQGRIVRVDNCTSIHVVYRTSPTPCGCNYSFIQARLSGIQADVVLGLKGLGYAARR